MSLRRSERSAGVRPARRDPETSYVVPGLIIATTAVVLPLVLTLPHQLVLPAVSAVACFAAAATAIAAYLTRAAGEGDKLTLWDVAGGLAVIWIGAGVMSDADHIVRLYADLTASE